MTKADNIPRVSSRSSVCSTIDLSAALASRELYGTNTSEEEDNSKSSNCYDDSLSSSESKSDFSPRVSSQQSEFWKLYVLADVAARLYGTISTTEEDNSKSSSSRFPSLLARESKPDFSPRVYSRPSKNRNLELLAAAASAALDEEIARIFFKVPRKKRSRRSRHRSSSSMAWPRVIEKQRSSVIRVDYKELERSLMKRKIAGRFEVGSSSPSSMEDRVQDQNPNRDPESSPSSCVTTDCKKRPPTNVCRGKKSKTVRRLDVGPTQTTSPPTTPPEWLLNVMVREGNGYDPKLIIARKLFKTDLSKEQARLLMPLKQMVNSDFLNEEETRALYEQSVLKTHKEGVSVDLVDPLSNKHVVNLRKWQMSGNWNYVFVDGWNDVVDANTFKVDDVYPLWSFRSGRGKLCFALVPPPARNSGQGGSTSGESGNVINSSS